MRINNLFVNHSDGQINEILGQVIPLLTNCRCVIVRGLDSTRNSSELAQFLNRNLIDTRIIGNSVFIEFAYLSAMLSKNLLTGFDELWFLNDKPIQIEIPEELYLTSEGVILGKDQFDYSELSKLCCEANCILILADGCGLNYATTSDELENSIKEILQSIYTD